MNQMTDIPYFTLRDGMNSTVTLNNVGPTSTPVTVTIYNTEGKGQTLKPITLAPHSFKQIELRDVVVGDDFDSGNLNVAYSGISMGVTCQVSVSNPADRVSFESRDVWGQQDMQDMMGSMSKSMSGILWLPQESAEGFLAVTNIGKTKVTVQVSTGSKPKTVTLYSRETRLVKLSEESGEQGPGASLVKLLYIDGMVGDVVTTGFVLDLKRGYSSAFTLFDPGLTRSRHLSGAHLRIGEPDPNEGFPEGALFRSPLLLANIGTNPVKAHVSVDYTVRKKLAMSRRDDKGSSDSEGATEEKSSTVTVKDLTIAPGDVTRIELSEALEQLGIDQITEAGVDIDYDTPPGTLIGHLVSVDQSGDYSFEVPIKDPAGMMEMTDGIYPWTLEDGNNTVLHLKNTTNQPVNGLLLFDYYDNGIVKTYDYPEIVLEPYQTVAIDIQKLKDSRKPDLRGQLFPGDVTHGQAQWRQETPYTIIGRAEETNVKTGIARSFSCNYLCCTNYSETQYLVPDPFIGPTGQITQEVPWKQGTSCNGLAFRPTFDGQGLNWSSDAPNIASVDSAGNVTLRTVGGNTYVNADLLETWYQSDFPCTCTRHSDHLAYTSAAVTTLVPTSLRMNKQVSTTYHGSNIFECDEYFNPPVVRWGWSDCVEYQLLDQNGGVLTGNQYFEHEQMDTMSSNPPGLTITPFGAPWEFGLVNDFLSWTTTSSAGIPLGQFVHVRQTLFAQNINTNTYYLVQVNCLDYEPNGVFITQNIQACQ
jgi:hypothetical protein